MAERLNINGGGPRLEGVLGRGEAGSAVVAHPHPLQGGEMSNPVVSAIAEGLKQAGIAALRFNFRGCGDSDGAPTADAAAADEDMRAAFAELRGRHPGPYLAAGYSFGAATALRVAAAEPSIERLILVAPPLMLIDRGALQRYPGPITVLVGDDDAYARLPDLERVLERNARVNLQILEDEDHFFSAGGALLAPLVAAAAAGR